MTMLTESEQKVLELVELAVRRLASSMIGVRHVDERFIFINLANEIARVIKDNKA